MAGATKSYYQGRGGGHIIPQCHCLYVSITITHSSHTPQCIHVELITYSYMLPVRIIQSHMALAGTRANRPSLPLPQTKQNQSAGSDDMPHTERVCCYPGPTCPAHVWHGLCGGSYKKRCAANHFRSVPIANIQLNAGDTATDFSLSAYQLSSFRIYKTYLNHLRSDPFSDFFYPPSLPRVARLFGVHIFTTVI